MGRLQGQMTKQSPFLDAYRRIYGAFGFQKGYNFPLYLITVGGLLGFILARLQYLNVDGIFAKSAIPGEFYYFQAGRHRVGIILHLVGIFFGGLLAVLQFTPIIRHKAIIIHRITGYFAATLFLLGNVGAFMIMDRSIGGSPPMRVAFGVLGTGTTFAILFAYISIKRLQIDQHRAWMIRTWVWAACIISLRLILLAANHVTTVNKIPMTTPIRCDEIFWMFGYYAKIPAAFNPTIKIYPKCGPNPATSTLEMGVTTKDPGPQAVAAMIRPNFIMATWLAMIIHVFLVELYLWLTPTESYRLRVLSRKKQIERGWIKPDQWRTAGIDSTRIGDAPKWWAMDVEGYVASRESAAQEADVSPEREGKETGKA